MEHHREDKSPNDPRGGFNYEIYHYVLRRVTSLSTCRCEKFTIKFLTNFWISKTGIYDILLENYAKLFFSLGRVFGLGTSCEQRSR